MARIRYIVNGDITQVVLFDKVGTEVGRCLIDTDDREMLEPLGSWWLDDHGYARGTGKARMHRVVIGAKDGEIVDHINGNQLDNRKSNLRLCEAWENQQNRRGANKNSATGVKGVTPEMRSHRSGPTTYTGRYFAMFEWDRTTYRLGAFDTVKEASKAIDDKKSELRKLNNNL